MRKIAELEQELLQVKTAQLSVQQVMEFNSNGYAQQQPPMLEEGMFERLQYQNNSISQAAAYSDMPHHHHQMQ